jgi:hypothetical protein
MVIPSAGRIVYSTKKNNNDAANREEKIRILLAGGRFIGLSASCGKKMECQAQK